jgi:hypothetical protein
MAQNVLINSEIKKREGGIKMKKAMHLSVGVLMIILICFCLIGEAGAEGKSSLTLINQSGDNALVKLTGPSRKTVEISNGSSRTVNIAGGQYTIYVRYGTPGRYRYTKGESFQIDETSITYTRASLTLHGVANGNYRTEGSSESEFNRQ